MVIYGEIGLYFDMSFRKKIEPAIADIPLGNALIRVLALPPLRRPVFDCVVSIFSNFFFLQYKAARQKGLIPVSRVDHPLDEKIPFKPRWVNIYLDFVAFWIRMLGFLLGRYGRRALVIVKDFIESMDKLYRFAAEVYSVNMSTTKRPRYLGRPRFVVIHVTDPHLMCIPSLHVMVVIFTYTQFRRIAESLGEKEVLKAQQEELRLGALRITEAVLFVKQHSINCIAAALYAIRRFDPSCFSVQEAEEFTSQLLINEKAPSQKDSKEIQSHITTLFHRFLSEGENTPSWKDPLLNYLSRMRNT